MCEFSQFKDIIIITAKITNNNLRHILDVTNKFFNDCYDDYKYWIQLNMSNINNENPNIKYIYYNLLNDKYKKGQVDFVQFENTLETMNEFFDILKSFWCNKKLIEDVKIEDVKVKIVKKKVPVEKIDSDVEFYDAKNSNRDSNDDSEAYNDSDDADTIYKKTMNNAKVRTTRRINSKK
jgi:hypothetical protein